MFDNESKTRPAAKKFHNKVDKFFIYFIIKIVKKDDKYINKMFNKIETKG